MLSEIRSTYTLPYQLGDIPRGGDARIRTTKNVSVFAPDIFPVSYDS